MRLTFDFLPNVARWGEFMPHNLVQLDREEDEWVPTEATEEPLPLPLPPPPPPSPLSRPGTGERRGLFDVLVIHSGDYQ